MRPATIHNLTFHGVGEPPRSLDPGEAIVWLSTDRFTAMLDTLVGRADVRITFDDGNRSDVEVALPALALRGLNATFFVLAGRLDDPEHLGCDDLERLIDAGMTIGSHGLSHLNWRRCDDEQLAGELAQSRRILEAVTRRPVTRVAVPFGAYDRRVLRHARHVGGYERVFTSDGGPARPAAWLQPRTTVINDAVALAELTVRPDMAGAARRRVKQVVKRWR